MQKAKSKVVEEKHCSHLARKQGNTSQTVTSH